MYDENTPAVPPHHADIIQKFLNDDKSGFMLTISRDGESPARSIYHFSDALTAVEAYNRYDNFGFAKDFLTVSLYEPDNRMHTKVLKRPPAGECSYVKKNYVEAADLLKSFKKELTDQQYTRLVKGFALIFAQDNIRFNPSRFFQDANCEEVTE